MDTTTTTLIAEVTRQTQLGSGYIILALLAVWAIVIGLTYLHHKLTAPTGHKMDRDTKSFLVAYSCGLATAYIVLLGMHLITRLL
jgi:hypothetical protein